MVNSTEQSLNIFVSYKSKDQAIAEKFKTLLYGVLVPDKQKLLDVFISNGIPKGEDWEKSIHEALRKCDCFILLYTDPMLEWSWCLYESGFYIGKRLDDGKLNRKYIILHSPDTKPPAPLSRWQAVSATPEEIDKLLRTLFCSSIGENDEPLSPETPFLADFKSTTESIATLIGPTAIRTYYTKHIHLMLKKDAIQIMQSTDEIPATTAVESDEKSLTLFGRRPTPAPLTWEGLIKRLKQMNERNFELSGWEFALCRAIVDAIEGNDFVPELPLFRAYDGKSYHSTLQILDRFSDSLFGIDVIFAELLPGQDPRPEGQMGRLSYMLTVSRHFRWGVCEPSLKEVARIENAPASLSESRQQLKRLAANLKTGIDRALHEGVREYNLLDRRISIEVCIDDADRQEMANIFTIWEEMFPSLLQLLNTENPELPAIRAQIEDLKNLNKRYMQLVAKRYYQEVLALT